MKNETKSNLIFSIAIGFALIITCYATDKIIETKIAKTLHSHQMIQHRLNQCQSSRNLLRASLDQSRMYGHTCKIRFEKSTGKDFFIEHKGNYGKSKGID